MALVPALDAVLRLGRLHPDEVFQHLEPALWRAFGFGTLAWEWHVGLRNWAVPGLFALLLRGASALGLDGVLARRIILELPQYALTAAALAAVFRLAARRSGRGAGRLALWLFGLSPLFVWFAGRTLGESLSATFLVWGLERLDVVPEGEGGGAPSGAPAVAYGSRQAWARQWPAFLGGLLLGCAVVVRYGSAAFVVPALVVLVIVGRFRALAAAVGGGAFVCLALGLLDRATWGATLAAPRFGGFWHSFFEYFEFNVRSGRAAAEFGAHPWFFYLPLLALVPPWAVVGLARWPRAPRERAWLFVVPPLAYLAAVSATAHKEERFLYPALVLFGAAAVPAFAGWAAPLLRSGSALARSLAVAAVLGSAVPFFVPTPFDVRVPEQFQLTLRAGREANGFVLMGDGLWGSGGHFYLGRNIPWCRCDTPEEPCFHVARSDRRFDRAVYSANHGDLARAEAHLRAFEALGFRRVEQRGSAWLLARD